jgi:hypothetical protein
MIALVVIFSFTTSACAGWLVYHKPEYSGKVVDSETRQPIESAVVVAVYNKTTMGLGAGTLSSIINVQETLTDKDGLFRIPSYTTIIQPFSWEVAATFIVFKPGYAAVSGLDLEENLSKETAQTGELPWIENKNLKFSLSSKLIGLPKLKTREERKLSRMSVDISGADVDARDLTGLYKIINEERKNGF